MSHNNRGGKAPYTQHKKHNSDASDNVSRDVDKKVKQIQEMFGDWKKSEILSCLAENNYDVNVVVQKKVEGKEDWKTVEKKEIRTQKSSRGSRGGRGGSRGGQRGNAQQGSTNNNNTKDSSNTPRTSSQQEGSTNDKQHKKKQTKQDKTTSSEVRTFSAPEGDSVEETPKQQTQPQQAKLSYSEAAAAYKKKEDEEKKKFEEEKQKLEQQAKDQKEQAKNERTQQRKKKGDKKAPKEEIKETPVIEQVQQPVAVTPKQSIVEEEVPEEEFATEEEAEQPEEQVEIQQPSQQAVSQQTVTQTYQPSFEPRPSQHEEQQPQLQMPSHLYGQAPVSLQFGTLDLGSQPKAQPQNNSVNQPNNQTNQQMQNGFWNDPKMHNYIPYIPNQYPFHPQYYPYIYHYYQQNAAQGVNNKNYNQGFGYQEGFGMYNQVSGNEDAEQTHQDASSYQFQMQQPYFLMYPQQQQQQQMDSKHKSESPQNDAKVNPYPTYLPGYQNQYPQYFNPNQMMYPHYPSGNATSNQTTTSTHQPNQKKW